MTTKQQQTLLHERASTSDRISLANSTSQDILTTMDRNSSEQPSNAPPNYSQAGQRRVQASFSRHAAQVAYLRDDTSSTYTERQSDSPPFTGRPGAEGNAEADYSPASPTPFFTPHVESWATQSNSVTSIVQETIEQLAAPSMTSLASSTESEWPRGPIAQPNFGIATFQRTEAVASSAAVDIANAMAQVVGQTTDEATSTLRASYLLCPPAVPNFTPPAAPAPSQPSGPPPTYHTDDPISKRNRLKLFLQRCRRRLPLHRRNNPKIYIVPPTPEPDSPLFYPTIEPQEEYMWLPMRGSLDINDGQAATETGEEEEKYTEPHRDEQPAANEGPSVNQTAFAEEHHSVHTKESQWEEELVRENIDEDGDFDIVTITTRTTEQYVSSSYSSGLDVQIADSNSERPKTLRRRASSVYSARRWQQEIIVAGNDGASIFTTGGESASVDSEESWWANWDWGNQELR